MYAIRSYYVLATSAPPAMALVIVYIALFLLCQAVLPSRVILFALALAGLGYALAGLSDVVNVQLGLVDQLSSLYPGRLVGRFAQPNLLGCFMVVAMVSLVQLLNEEPPRKSNRLVVITSYSIHYTKLYELRQRFIQKIITALS